MSHFTPLGAGGEFDLVRRLVARWGAAAAGLGDDAAILDVPAGARLVASTDTSYEGVHFRRDWLFLHEVAWRATTASLSDLAAMAAQPLGLLVALTLPDPGELDDLADGVADAARAAQCPIVGGDLTHGDRLSLTITVLGTANRPLSRSGARPGDAVFVTGVLGGPAAAVRAMLRGAGPEPAHRARFARPAARIGEALWLAQRGATACIDISDGLVPEAGHLAAASGVGLEVQLEQVPAMPGIEATTAATSGEEYELLLTAPPGLDASAFAARFGVPLTRIGTVVEGDAIATFTREGRRVDLAGGYDHFSG